MIASAIELRRSESASSVLTSRYRFGSVIGIETPDVGTELLASCV